MGLDFAQSDAHWSYSGFNDFRRRLSFMLDFDLRSMVGFGGERSWNAVPQDDILVLLNHSDCEGILSPAECAVVGPRLRETFAP